MNESFDNLESRLAGIHPRPLNPAVESRIASALAEDAAAESPASPPRNRFFWSIVTSGAIAACVIAGVFLTEPAASHPTPPSQLAGTNSPGPELATLARADWRYADDFTFDSHRSHR